MKGVMNSLRNWLPGGQTSPEAEPPIEDVPLVDKISADKPAFTTTFGSDPAQRPLRQMVELADIKAMEAEVDPFAELDKHDAPPAPVKLDRDPALEALVMEAIKVVRDPEIPVNLVDLGLIYDFNVDVAGKVDIEMTLTTPNCPSAADLPQQIEYAAKTVEGVTAVSVKVVFTPPWHQGLMSEEARLELGLM